MDKRLLNLIATVIEWCKERRLRAPGHPTAGTVRVLVMLRQFLREGKPWRSLGATHAKASDSMLRRCLARWMQSGLLARVHAMLVAMLRGNPVLIIDSCSVRAKRGGDLTGPNPTDCAQEGNQLPHRGQRRWHPGRMPGDGRQRLRHGAVRTPVPERIHRLGQDQDRVRRQGL